GREAFAHRLAFVCDNCENAISSLESGKGVISSADKPADQAVVFLFPGQGAQYANMGRTLHDSEPTFRVEVDQCLELLKSRCDLDLRDILFSRGLSEGTHERLNQTEMAQTALFVIEYALAKLWMDWGVQPRSMVGHSLGEYVAACLASVLSLPDALTLVADRGRLMQQAPRGSMLAVPLPATQIELPRFHP